MQLVIRSSGLAIRWAVWLSAFQLIAAGTALAATRLEIQDEPLSELQSDATIEAGDAAFSRGDFGAAREAYGTAAMASVPAIRAGALNRLGILYERALGVAQDHRLAFDHFRRAADLGNRYAQANIGDFYAYGLGVVQNNQLALKWYRSAALQDVPPACNALGWAYLQGLGVPRSPSDALLWYERGADLGSPNAAYQIGWIYGNVEPINYIDAMRWYRIAAAHKHREAQNNIGAFYEAGLGVEQDDVQAAYWYQLASDAGLARAQYQLAQLYLNGRGVERNAERAGELMASAARGGDSQAQVWQALHRVTIKADPATSDTSQ